MNFDDAFKIVVGEEGGWGAAPGDRGNWTSGIVGVGKLRGTKYGISAMAYPDEDIQNLTLDRAKFLYKRDYWDKMSLDSVPGPIGLGLFDCGVNQGTAESAKLCQKALGYPADGILRSSDIARLNTIDIKKFARSFAIARIVEYSSLSYWVTDHDGWVGRVLDIYAHMIM
jgi:lysozyme family protein